MKIEFLSVDDILRIHQDQVTRYGGSTSIPDLNLLLSATAMPQATFSGAYLHQDLFEMAAAYLFHLVQDHPFIDGNKRTGLVAALMFLTLNGVEIAANNRTLVDFVFRVAQGQEDKSSIAHFFRQHQKHASR